jgi:hypothetical protein
MGGLYGRAKCLGGLTALSVRVSALAFMLELFMCARNYQLFAYHMVIEVPPTPAAC